MKRMGARVQWFDPKRPASLAEQLRQLTSDYSRIRAESLEQKKSLHARGWTDVAGEYESLLLEILPVRKLQ
jgi:hypothetical protein